jgi:protein-S-isoprenylcysteine O-methyltransferase Ste14
MFVLARALTYSTLFVGVLLVYLPGRLLAAAGIAPPARLGLPQGAGLLLGAAGAALALSAILAVVTLGRGTPAPFDPPRRLVVRGPYALVRNPMYLGAGAALTGAALYYQSRPLLGYAGAFLVAMHLMAVGYEEPALRATFGEAYAAYCRRVGRWLPRGRRGVRASH